MSWATPEQRCSLGRSRRKQLGRQQNDQLSIKLRKASPTALLKRAEQGRIPALLNLKHQLMAESPFVYFRGAAPVMAADLGLLPNTGIDAQICGDAHVRNLGAFAAPDGRLVFDINDFDETIRGPFEWDLKRMAASIVLAARESHHRETSARDAVHHCVICYCQQVRAFARLPLLEVARFQVHRLMDVEPVHQALLKAERATPLHNLDMLTEPVPGRPGVRRFRETKPRLTRLTGSQAEKVFDSLRVYRETLEPQRQHLLGLYRPVDVAFKVVGTGSIGLRDYCIYLEGNGPNDPLFLQIKEETASAYYPYLPNPRLCPHNGERVATGQRAMQLQSDPFLGWTQIGARQFLVRQLNDHKASIDLSDLAGSGLVAFGEVCGELLARGHARSGDPLVISSYLGNGEAFAEALARFGSLYADQTERDWQAFRRSRKLESPEERSP